MLKENHIKYLVLVVIFFSSICFGKEQKIDQEIESAFMAGFISAHSIYSVVDGETLIPIFAFRGDDNKNNLVRLNHESLEDAVNVGRASLVENTEKSNIAVLSYDGYIPLDDGKYDAIFVEFLNYANLNKYIIAIPYQHASEKSSFTVFKPKLIDFPEKSDNSLELVMESFWAGVQGHPEGSKIWNDNIDQSK